MSLDHHNHTGNSSTNNNNNLLESSDHLQQLVTASNRFHLDLLRQRYEQQQQLHRLLQLGHYNRLMSGGGRMGLAAANDDDDDNNNNWKPRQLFPNLGMSNGIMTTTTIAAQKNHSNVRNGGAGATFVASNPHDGDTAGFSVATNPRPCYCAPSLIHTVTPPAAGTAAARIISTSSSACPSITVPAAAAAASQTGAGKHLHLNPVQTLTQDRIIAADSVSPSTTTVHHPIIAPGDESSMYTSQVGVVVGGGQGQQKQQERIRKQPHLLQVVSEMAPMLREQLLYVAVKMERKDVTRPWGLGFAKHGQDRVLVTKSNIACSSSSSSSDASNNSFVSWANVIRVKDHVLLDPHTIYDKTAYSAIQSKDAYCEKLHNFLKQLSKTSCQPKSSTSPSVIGDSHGGSGSGGGGDFEVSDNEIGTVNSHQSSDYANLTENYDRRLLPGDLIMAVDGRSMFDFDHASVPHPLGAKPSERTLHNLTSYLRGATNVCIVVLRMIPGARKRAVVVPEARVGPGQAPLDVASNIRYMEWSRILPPPKIIHATPLSRCKVSSSYLQHGRMISHQQQSRCKPPSPPVVVYRNPWFKEQVGTTKADDVDEGGQQSRLSECILYADNFVDNSKEDGTRGALFLSRIGSFGDWLSLRKRTWRDRYTVYTHPIHVSDDRGDDNNVFHDPEMELLTVSRDFWTCQGFCSFEEWLETRVITWRRSYSWNRQKKRRIQQECDAVIHLQSHPTGCQFEEWLKIRRNQWRIQTRKRQRLSSNADFHSVKNEMDEEEAISMEIPSDSDSKQQQSSEMAGRVMHLWSSDQPREIVFIDELLEEAEHRQRKRVKRAPFDLRKFFDNSFGMPDDAIFVFLSFLDSKEHGKVLGIDKVTSKCLMEREDVWKQLCPSRWKLPRRPRKPWHVLYLTNLRNEHEINQKRWDDLLIKVAGVLERSDAIQKVEKLVKAGEAEFGFEVNYISSVVMERNSILNLATINGRHKVVRWLVETKRADIESFDRGCFTPLANAAWAGDRQLVRYFMSKGADRTITCTQHSSQPIAPPEFKGLTPAEWAEKRGHKAIAKLIQDGL